MRGGQQGWPRVEKGRRGARALETSPDVVQRVNLPLWWATGIFWGGYRSGCAWAGQHHRLTGYRLSAEDAADHGAVAQ